jgi:peptidoglycan/LPS O-acetylase OafA/YrhL
MSSPPDRYHALDSLRGFAMLLGVVLHAGISFMVNVPAFWTVRDRNPSGFADLFLFAVHDFRMQAFFLLAGFFGCLLYRRYGAAGTARHRVKRVAVPLALGAVFVIPTVMAAFMYAELENARAEGLGENPTDARRAVVGLIEANPGAGNAAIILERFASGDALPLIRPAHLWFLYYLLIFYAVVLPLAPLAKPLGASRVDAAFRWAAEGRARIFVPALATLPVLLCMKTPMADTPLGWAPELRILAYYFFFFAFGWMLYRQRDLVASFGRGWRLNLAVANVAVLPVMLGLTFGGLVLAKGEPEAVAALARHWPGAESPESRAAAASALRVGGFVAQSLYTWLMIVGLWGLFLRYFSHPSAWVRYMADASYWCYLASITPIVAFQFVVKDWPLPGLLKWVLVSAATMAVLLASYEWCVRYTFIGAILNGRKYRQRGEVKSRETVPEAVLK